jgi:DNA-binding NarL/FixJ family response regulator
MAVDERRHPSGTLPLSAAVLARKPGTPPPSIRPCAVVVDRWPLMRLGIGRALGLAEVRPAGEGEDLADGLRLVRQHGAGILVLGDANRGDAEALGRARERGETLPRVVMLVRMITRSDLTTMLGAGVSGVSLRSVAPEELADLVRRVRAGERVISPALLPSLAGFTDGSARAEPPATGVLSSMAVPLTSKERQVLIQLGARANQQIAEALFVTPATVKTHLAHIYVKLGVGSRHEAISRAVALGIIH